MPFVTSGASRIHYEVQGEGPPLVLIHGVGGNHASWHGQVPVFSRCYRTVTVDQRGFGLSEDVEGTGRSAMVDDLRAVLDALGIEKTILVAQSMSGGVAVNFACRHAERVRAVVLADTVVGFDLPPDLAARQEAMNVAARDFSTAERVFAPGFPSREPVRAYLYGRIAGFNRYNARNVAGDFPKQAPQALGATGLPTLFLAGAEERRFPIEVIRGVQALVTGSQYVEVPGAGHSVYFERPDAFNEAVLDFLSGIA